jgi:hypothetical protein
MAIQRLEEEKREKDNIIEQHKDLTDIPVKLVEDRIGPVKITKPTPSFQVSLLQFTCLYLKNLKVNFCLQPGHRFINNESIVLPNCSVPYPEWFIH